MSADVINLRLARKRKARDDKEKQAADNRLYFGRSKVEKLTTRKTGELEAKRLEGHRMDASPEAPSGTSDHKSDTADDTSEE